MTISDDQVHSWIASLVERTGGQLRVELDGLVRQVHESVLARASARAETPGPEAVELTIDRRADAPDPSASWIETRQADLATASAVLDAMTAMDATRSLSGVLDVLVHRTAMHTGRVLLVVKRGMVLTGWRWYGYTPDPRDATTLEIGFGDEGLVARAASSGMTTTGTGPAAGTAAASSPGESRAAIAVPLRVGGDVVAVLYAEDAGDARAARSFWPEVMGILASHAARCLESMTARRLGALVPAQTPVRLAPLPDRA